MDSFKNHDTTLDVAFSESNIANQASSGSGYYHLPEEIIIDTKQRLDRRFEKASASLAVTRKSMKMFDLAKGVFCAPSNWEDLSVNNDLVALFNRMIIDCKVQIVLSEEHSDLQLRDSRDFDLFLNAITFALEEGGLRNTNFQSTSIIEQIRVCACLRRARGVCTALHLPWHMSKWSHAPQNISDKPGDYIFEMIVAQFFDKTLGKTVAQAFCKLFTKYCIKASPDAKSVQLGDLALPFEEVWSNLGMIKRDVNGNAKRTKDNKFKRYHPTVPRVPWMLSLDVAACKEIWREPALQLQKIKASWSFESVKDYLCCITELKALYEAQVQISKRCKTELDARLERLGCGRSVTKKVFIHKVNNHMSPETLDINWPRTSEICRNIFISAMEKATRECASLSASVEVPQSDAVGPFQAQPSRS
jgi:hypothetical protein